MAEELLTVSEVAEILKTNMNFVYKLQQAGLIKFMKIGRLKCRRSSLDKFIETFDGYDITDPENIKELSKGISDETD